MIADGACDGEPTYRAVTERQPDPPMTVIIPPRSTAVPSAVAGTSSASKRDQHIEMIHATSRMAWQKATGYGMRSHAETAIFRYKTIIGCSLRTRTLSAQKTETKAACLVLNRMTNLGIPVSQRIC